MIPARYCTHCQNMQAPSGFEGPGRDAKCKPCAAGRKEDLERTRLMSKKADDLVARYRHYFERGVDVKLLFNNTNLAKTTLHRLVRNAESRGVIHSRPKGQGYLLARMYFLSEKAAREYKPIERMKAALPANTRKNPAKFRASDVAKNIGEIEIYICPSNRDTRYTPVEPYPKVFSEMPIGQYL